MIRLRKRAQHLIPLRRQTFTAPKEGLFCICTARMIPVDARPSEPCAKPEGKQSHEIQSRPKPSTNHGHMWQPFHHEGNLGDQSNPKLWLVLTKCSEGPPAELKCLMQSCKMGRRHVEASTGSRNLIWPFGCPRLKLARSHKKLI